MSPEIQQALVGESEIIVTVRIPLDFEADRPLAHLANEGRIQEGVRLVGRKTTEKLYQRIADQQNGIESYSNAEGYRMRNKGPSTVPYGCPYGHIHVSRSYFYNNHTKTGQIPFEQQTRMETHAMTPMLQFIALRKLCEQGPEAAVVALEEDYGVKLSHHLLDQFLESIGWKYQDLRQDMVEGVLEADWKPPWLPSAVEVLPSGEEDVSQTESHPSGEAQPPSRSLMEHLSVQTQKKILPMMQADAMTVTIRKYASEAGQTKVDGRKYHTERHQLHNGVVGFVGIDGPREPGDKIDLHGKRYFSEYFSPDDLPRTTCDYLRACGMQPGDLILLNGDGDPRLWERNREVFKEFKAVEILDERHARGNLFKAAEFAYPKNEGKCREWVEKQMGELYEGRYKRFFYALDYLVRNAKDEETRQPLKTKRGYFRKNKHRIRYKEFLEKGYPISTCFVESAHNHVIGDRVRNNGRSYLEYRLQMIADFRAEHKSKRLPYVFQLLMEKPAA